MKKSACETTEHQCSFLNQCDLVRKNATKTPELIRRIQSQHCTKADYRQCARFQIYESLGTDAVPPLMLPEPTDCARQIIEEHHCNSR